MRLPAVAAAVMMFVVPVTAHGQTEYVIGSQDVLLITVFNHEDLTGTFEVEMDGTLIFPLIGQVDAAGLTLRELETTVTWMLLDGFLRNPQVDAVVTKYRSQQVFVLGEVRSPGAYPFTGQMTLIEVLARAGSTTRSAGTEARVVRQLLSGEQPYAAVGSSGDAQESQTEVIHVDLPKLHQGLLEENVILRAGDTVIVDEAELVYVFGQVSRPGAYPLQPGMTVLQALSLAGGVTDRGAAGRINVIREVDGEQQEIRVTLEDLVQPGDTLVVPQRYF